MLRIPEQLKARPCSKCINALRASNTVCITACSLLPSALPISS
jgi:hypothetical protein